MNWINLAPDHPLWVNLAQLSTIDYQEGDRVLYLWTKGNEAFLIKDPETITRILKAIGAKQIEKPNPQTSEAEA